MRGYWKITESLEVVHNASHKNSQKGVPRKSVFGASGVFFSADRREEFPRFKCNFQVMSGL